MLEHWIKSVIHLILGFFFVVSGVYMTVYAVDAWTVQKQIWSIDGRSSIEQHTFETKGYSGTLCFALSDGEDVAYNRPECRKAVPAEQVLNWKDNAHSKGVGFFEFMAYSLVFIVVLGGLWGWQAWIWSETISTIFQSIRRFRMVTFAILMAPPALFIIFLWLSVLTDRAYSWKNVDGIPVRVQSLYADKHGKIYKGANGLYEYTDTATGKPRNSIEIRNYSY